MMNVSWPNRDITYLENFYFCQSISTYFNVADMFELNEEDI